MEYYEHDSVPCTSLVYFPLNAVNIRYLDSVLPDEFGVRQTPLFFLKKSYWGFKRKSAKTEHRDLSAWLTTTSTRYTQKSTPKTSNLRYRPSIFRGETKSSQSTPDSSQDSSPTDKLIADIEVSHLHEAAHDISTPAALRVVHLRKTFPPDSIAVSDSNFVMHQGELLAVIGANGSGKSTTCHVLCGITPATAGDALVDDSISLLESSCGEGLVGWCPQHDILFDELTPLEHVFSHFSRN